MPFDRRVELFGLFVCKKDLIQLIKNFKKCWFVHGSLDKIEKERVLMIF